MIMARGPWLISVLAWCTLFTFGTSEDIPCAARNVGIPGRSIVCVCNATYCDTITREEPEPGTYVVYTSTLDGKRFEKTFGVIELIETKLDDDDDDDTEIEEDFVADDVEDSGQNQASLRIFRNTRFQLIEGFGGSVTDSTSMNWRKLSDAAQINLINSYFGSTGLEYNLIRVPIAGTDFSTHPYTYNEFPKNDFALSNYSLSSEDLFYKLPMIKRAQRASPTEIKITATSWSPPVWMKTNEHITGFGQLKSEYYQAYADYYLRFIEEYAKAEVPIWAITTTNEPINGIVPIVDFNSLGWLPSQLARWIHNNLGPTIRNSPFNSTLIIAIDDQRYLLPVYIIGMQRENIKAFDYIDGFAVHYYGDFAPPFILSSIHNKYPNKILLATEACEGPMPWHTEKVSIGSWRRGQNYAKSIFQNLNNYVVGWIDWNLCLDPEGGPNWVNNLVDAPILVYGEQDEFIKQPMFYAMGHFSKFIPRGSRRIKASRRSLLRIQNLAVLTPKGNIVMVLQNARDRQIQVNINLDRRRVITINMEPQSLKSIEIAI